MLSHPERNCGGLFCLERRLLEGNHKSIKPALVWLWGLMLLHCFVLRLFLGNYIFYAYLLRQARFPRGTNFPAKMVLFRLAISVPITYLSRLGGIRGRSVVSLSIEVDGEAVKGVHKQVVLNDIPANCAVPKTGGLGLKHWWRHFLLVESMFPAYSYAVIGSSKKSDHVVSQQHDTNASSRQQGKQDNQLLQFLADDTGNKTAAWRERSYTTVWWVTLRMWPGNSTHMVSAETMCMRPQHSGTQPRITVWGTITYNARSTMALDKRTLNSSRHIRNIVCITTTGQCQFTYHSPSSERREGPFVNSPGHHTSSFGIVDKPCAVALPSGTWNYFPSVVTNLTGRMPVSLAVKIDAVAPTSALLASLVRIQPAPDRLVSKHERCSATPHTVLSNPRTNSHFRAEEEWPFPHEGRGLRTVGSPLGDYTSMQAGHWSDVRLEWGMEQRRNEEAGEKGDPRENPPTSGIVRYDSPHAKIRRTVKRKFPIKLACQTQRPPCFPHEKIPGEPSLTPAPPQPPGSGSSRVVSKPYEYGSVQLMLQHADQQPEPTCVNTYSCACR
ncbi:hypothetical protein PR048_002139 [Dryococelus australis]|uniref:Uncharacterized protein n=1 Tax=Dryococelus australis TaxID=614101 RepID=A0ABQ9IJB9_9NEOP|nr:hypothetical protein PR048_002139 [Dryococelus australis]